MKRFEAFQGLRAVAFVLIFMSHSFTYLSLPMGEHGAIGVSVFFALSGFLVETHYKESTEKSLLEQGAAYAKRKIGKFYGLHLLLIPVALLPVVARLVMGSDQYGWTETALQTLANILLVQSWIPDPGFYLSLNSVTWYLSASVFLYFVSPFLHRFISGIPKKTHKALLLPAVLAVQLALACVFRTTALAHGFLYVNPLSRWLDYLAGMVLASLYKEKVMCIFSGNLAETGAFAALAAVILVFNRIPPAWKYVALSAPMAWALVFSLAHQKGWISKVLSCRVLTFLGDISFEMFMIHLLVIRYWGYMLDVVRNILGWEIPGLVSFAGIFAVTVFGAWLIQKAMATMKKKQEAVHERK